MCDINMFDIKKKKIILIQQVAICKYINSKPYDFGKPELDIKSFMITSKMNTWFGMYKSCWLIFQ